MKRKERIVLVGKPEGKGALGRPRHVLDDNIKTYLKEINGARGLDQYDSG